MARLVEFDISDGEAILVEVEDVESEEIEPVSKSPGEIAAKAKKTFAEALDNLEPMARSIKQRLDALTDPADEVEVKFSVKLSGEVGAVLTKVGGEATYEITLKWQHS
ncbi:MAG: CU044_2847 family protein [Leptolyngbyaceae cyanobacterium MO_188.B28]|nr:CU044_2847 family protein [Leptolyngbyaceae cyanobacterium MO_188.B28]